MSNLFQLSDAERFANGVQLLTIKFDFSALDEILVSRPEQKPNVRIQYQKRFQQKEHELVPSRPDLGGLNEISPFVFILQTGAHNHDTKAVANHMMYPHKHSRFSILEVRHEPATPLQLAFLHVDILLLTDQLRQMVHRVNIFSDHERL